MGIGVEGHDDTYRPGPLTRWWRRLLNRWRWRR